MIEVSNRPSWDAPPPKHIPPPVGSPMFFHNIGEGLYPYLVYTGALSFAYIAYRAGKVVYNQLR